MDLVGRDADGFGAAITCARTQFSQSVLQGSFLRSQEDDCESRE